MAVYSNRIVVSVSKAGIGPWLRITNSQSTAIQVGSQVIWQIPVSTLQARFPSLNSSLSNLRFVYNGQFVPAWLESINNGTATIWIKMPVSIAANSSITLNLYANSNLNFDGVYWGEAPQLSPTYGQYDNGASVFPTFYQNFAGTTCPSGWTCSGVTINNGISIPYSSYAITTTKYGLNANQILDFYGSFPTATSTANAGLGYTLSSSAVSSSTAIQTWIEINTYLWSNGYAGGLADQGSKWSYTSAMATGTHIWSIYWASSASASFYYDYGSAYIVTTNVYGSQLPIGGANNQVSQATIGPFYWIRLRAYPPNGVMPTVSIGSIA